MDWLGLKEEHALLRKEVATFCAREVAPGALEHDHKGEPPVELFGKLMDLGLGAIAVPETQGGAGMGALGTAIALEEVARVFPSLALSLAAQNLASVAVAGTCGTQATEGLVAEVLSGSRVVSLSLTDDPVTVSLSSSGMCASGQLRFVANGLFAGLCLATPLDSEQGIGQFCLLPMAECAMEPMGVVGFRASGLATLHCEEAALEGWQIRQGDRMRFHLYRQLCLAAIAVGICQGSLDNSRVYAGERHQFGRPIVDFDMVRRLLGEANRHAVAARLMTYDAAARLDQGLPAQQHLADACSWSRASAMLCADNAVQVFGGYGYTKDYPPEMFFRDAKFLELLPPVVAQARTAIP